MKRVGHVVSGVLVWYEKSRTHSLRRFGQALSHGLVLHIGLTSLHFLLDRIVQENYIDCHYVM